MGLGTSSSLTFLSIGDGKITRRVKEPTTRSRERTIVKSGKVIHEEIYDYVEGMITDIKVQVHPEYGRFWNVYMTDDTGAQYCLQMNYSSGYSSAFLKMLPNVDFSMKVKISPTFKEWNGKKRPGMFINQDGHALKHFYTKADMKGLPDLKPVTYRGEQKWDDTDMMEFLENMVNTEIKPKLAGRPGEPQPATSVAEAAPSFGGGAHTISDISAEDSDLPF